MNTDMRVAVCTNRLSGTVAEALDALRAQAGDVAVAIVTSGLDEPAVASHRAAFGGRVLVEARPGLSRARNRALAWAAEQGAEVLAFVDDDAVVEPGWWEALGRRWAEAPAEVACIGGPIRPRYSVEPPRWFSTGIAHTLTLLDRGPDVRDLDPAREEAVYGANISFRAGPLRRVGGFDPAWGHSGGRVFFGEEDEAQRALRRLGYTTRYVPDAAVDHVIPPDRLTRKAFINRRYAFGKALGARGGRNRSLAARQVATATVGTLLAAVQRDDAKLMERAVRGAENAGALTARRARA